MKFPSLVVLVAPVAVVALGAASAAPPPSRPTIIYAGGEPYPGQTMARIDARAPGPGDLSLQMMWQVSRKPRSPMSCEPLPYKIDADADFVELNVGRYRVRAKVALPMPPWSFEAESEITLESGRCYEPVLSCKGDARDVESCRLLLKQKRCARLRSPRRIVMRPGYAC